MKVPRWLMFVLSSTIAVTLLSSAAWCWVEWPEWTMQRFVQLVEQGDFDGANELMSPHSRWTAQDNWALGEDVGSSFNVGRVPGPDGKRWGQTWMVLSMEGSSQKRGYANPNVLEEPIAFVLPPHVWQAWFSSGHIDVAPRTRSDLIPGTLRFGTVEGHCQFLTRWGKVSILRSSPDEFNSFVEARNGGLSAYFRFRSSHRYNLNSTPETELRFFGPR